MPLVLDGTNGVSGVDGTASNPSYEGTDSNTGIFYPAADTVAIGTGGTERLRVDSAGNAGLGVTPSAWSTANSIRAFQIGPSGVGSFWNYNNYAAFVGCGYYWNGTNRIYLTTGNPVSEYSQNSGVHQWLTAPSGTAGNAITFTQAMTLDASGNLGIGTSSPFSAANQTSLTINATTYPRLDFYSGGTQRAFINSGSTDTNIYTVGATPLTFGTSNAERARITSAGEFLVGQTSASQTTVGFFAKANGEVSGCQAASTNGAGTQWNTYSTGAAAYRFYVGMGGTIFATSTTITAISSDERLKQNIVDYDKGLSEVLSLRPRYFEYKTEPDRRLAGFIAQEVETVMPDATEPTLQDPEMKTYSIDWYPLLVKAIQEQQAMIEEMKAEIAALKGNA